MADSNGWFCGQKSTYLWPIPHNTLWKLVELDKNLLSREKSAQAFYRLIFFLSFSVHFQKISYRMPSKYLKNFTYRFNPHWSSNYCFDCYSDTAHDVSIFQGFYQRGIGFILHCQRQYLSIKTLAFFYVFNKLLKSLSKLQRYFWDNWGPWRKHFFMFSTRKRS